MRAISHLHNVNYLTPSLMHRYDIRYNADPFAVSQYEFPSSRIRTFKQFLEHSGKPIRPAERMRIAVFRNPDCFPLARTL